MSARASRSAGSVRLADPRRTGFGVGEGRRETAPGGRRGRRGSPGFTLIELLVVIAIIGIVVTVAVGQYQKSILKAREAVLREDLYIMRTAINQYFADKGKYPADLETLVADSYLYKIPVDPITGGADTWQTRYAEMSEDDITTEPGIVDVFSGASGAGLDGSSYSDW